MKCDELKAYVAGIDGILHKNQRHGDVYLKDDVDAAIAELKQKLEDAKASHYAEMVDAGMRERRLRRALWVTRALRARDIQRWWLQVTCSPRTEVACRKWNNVERKCREKAEED